LILLLGCATLTAKEGRITVFTGETLEQVRQGMERWLQRTKGVSNLLSRKNQSACTSSVDVKPIYTPEDIKDLDFDISIGYPGEFPFTRGSQNTMYREKIWTMRMFSGFGSAEDTNKRWHHLLSEG
jgi:methylmalonyl-CoA mutase N-terminal domain/subunit